MREAHSPLFTHLCAFTREAHPKEKMHSALRAVEKKWKKCREKKEVDSLYFNEKMGGLKICFQFYLYLKQNFSSFFFKKKKMRLLCDKVDF